jgi:flagellar L-ring protein precursor FlgH
MKTSITMQNAIRLFVIATLLGCLAVQAWAQSSSLYGPPDVRDPLTLPNSSFMYLEIDPPKQIQLHDIVTVVVSESSQVFSEGEVGQKKRSKIDAVLADWLRLDGLDLKPAPQSDGDLAIRAKLESEYRADSELETRDGMKFRIAANVVDIRPNGNLILEARRTIQNNEETWEQFLTGTVRPLDVLPDNTVLSQNVADLRIQKRECGHVRDGYRRGWFLKFVDAIKPF